MAKILRDTYFVNCLMIRWDTSFHNSYYLITVRHGCQDALEKPPVTGGFQISFSFKNEGIGIIKQTFILDAEERKGREVPVSEDIIEGHTVSVIAVGKILIGKIHIAFHDVLVALEVVILVVVGVVINGSDEFHGQRRPVWQNSA